MRNILWFVLLGTICFILGAVAYSLKTFLRARSYLQPRWIILSELEM